MTSTTQRAKNRREHALDRVEQSLAPELRPIYRRLVQDYRAAAGYGRGFVCFDALAGLIRAGWRPQASEDRQCSG